jgi:Spy/CpxP family protein refolding chaperone
MRRDRNAKRIAAIALLAATAVAFGSLRATARPHGGGMCGARGAMLEKLERNVAGLGLAQKELDAVYQVIDQARREKRPLDAEVRAAHEHMRELLDQDQPSVDAVTAQADTIGSLTTQARKIELRAVVQVRNLLTPEQRKQLDGMHGRFARGERRGPPQSEL